MKNYFLLLILICGCKEVYNPPLKNPSTNYLVVDGNIIAGGDSTFIRLSKTTAVNDTGGINKPEYNASVIVESEDGESYQLSPLNDGMYAAALSINQNKNYRIHIETSDRKEYASDYVPVKLTPPIDSVSWKVDNTNSVNIYVTTHDAQNATKYYQWNFTETWQHRTSYTSGLIYENDSVRFRSPEEFINYCWTIVPSSSINILSNTQLSSDVIYENKLVNIPFNSAKISMVYSILVQQNALTKEGFEFWQNLQKNTEQLGSIFDPQPFADYGNIHCISDPQEPVIGFISACTVAQQRIYIYNSDLPSWVYQYPLCAFDTIPPATNSLLKDGAHVPLTYVPIPGSITPGILVTAIECADCRLQGGNNVKPSYMP